MQPSNHSRAAGESLSVLVIDDEPDVLAMLELSLSGMGYRVEAAGSGEEAIARAKQRRFDLAVADLRMPGLDGLATTRALKEIDPDLDVVIATAFISDETRAACLESGAADLIGKPFTLNALEAFLERVVASRRARRGDAEA